MRAGTFRPVQGLTRRLGGWPAVVAAALALALAPAAASAATITVDSTNDALAEDGHCTLREAVKAANTDTASGVIPGECLRGEGADTIKLPTGTYTLTETGSHEDLDKKGDLDIESDVAIEGAGAASTTIDGNGSVVGPSLSDRVLDVFQGSHGAPHVTISGVTIRNGLAPSLTGAIQDGGGILIDAASTVTLISDAITANKAGAGPITTRGGSGGGIENAGRLTLLATTVSENAAGNNDSGPTYPEGIGGGIDNTGTLSLKESTISANHTTFMSNGPLPGGPGGGIASSGASLTIDASTVARNFTSRGGEGGSGAKGGDGGGLLLTAGTLSLTNSTVDGNLAGNGAGGPESAAVGGSGGGLALEGGSAVLTNDTLSENSAGVGGVGPGAPTKPSAAGGNGGAILVTGGSAALTNVTIADNAAGLGGKAFQAGGPGPNGVGGGIDALASVGVLNSIIAASTLGGNCAGAVVDQGHNIDFAGGGCPAGFVHSDPLLGALQSNGGPTQTMALASSSSAVDQVPVSGTGCPAIDQRGVSRPQGPACDIGAYELAVPAVPSTPSGQGVQTTMSPTNTLLTTRHVAPAISRLTIAPGTFSPARSGASIAKSAKGATVSYNINEAAGTSLTVRRSRPGVRRNGRCLARKPGTHGGRPCTRLVAVGGFAHVDRAGRVSFHFSGRLSGHALAPGSYRLEAVPRADGLSGAPQSAPFQITR